MVEGDTRDLDSLVAAFRGADVGPVILEEDLVAAESEFAGGCMTGTCTF